MNERAPRSGAPFIINQPVPPGQKRGIIVLPTSIASPKKRQVRRRTGRLAPPRLAVFESRTFVRIINRRNAETWARDPGDRLIARCLTFRIAMVAVPPVEEVE